MIAPSDAGHDIVVKVGLTADQFVWLRDEAEARGLSLSALIRSLIQAERRRQHAAHLGIGAHPADSAEPGPVQAE